MTLRKDNAALQARWQACSGRTISADGASRGSFGCDSRRGAVLARSVCSGGLVGSLLMNIA